MKCKMDMHFQERNSVSFSSILDTLSSAEVPTCEDQGSHKSPEVKEEAHPAGTHFDPHSWPVAGYLLEFGIRAVPAGYGHHDVQGGTAEHQVEKGVVVLHPLLLVVYSPPRLSIFFITGPIGGITKDNTVTPREGQLINLAVARSTDARIYKADNKDSQSPQIIQIHEVSIL